jgi:hypothetical protein
VGPVYELPRSAGRPEETGLHQPENQIVLSGELSGEW